jgi:hypothetical protein
LGFDGILDLPVEHARYRGSLACSREKFDIFSLTPDLVLLIAEQNGARVLAQRTWSRYAISQNAKTFLDRRAR